MAVCVDCHGQWDKNNGKNACRKVKRLDAEKKNSKGIYLAVGEISLS